MRSNPSTRRWAHRGIQALFILGALAAWEFSAKGNRIVVFFFSHPTKIAYRLFEWVHLGELHRNALQTISETLTGFSLGAFIGITLAVLCYSSSLIYTILKPFIEIANGLPRVILAPLFTLWFGFGLAAKAALAASLVIFIVFFATLSGLDSVDQAIINRVRLMGANSRDLLVHVLLPSALGWIFASMRTAVGFALAGAVIGEYMGSSHGIGYQIALAEGNLDATGVIAGLVVLALLVLVLNAILLSLEHWLTPWRMT